MGVSTVRLPQPVKARVIKDFGPYHAGQDLDIDRIAGTMAGPVRSSQFLPTMNLDANDRAQINQMLTPATKT